MSNSGPARVTTGVVEAAAERDANGDPLSSSGLKEERR